MCGESMDRQHEYLPFRLVGMTRQKFYDEADQFLDNVEYVGILSDDGSENDSGPDEVADEEMEVCMDEQGDIGIALSDE
ncbi:hypothetical protein ILUMI_03991 [Ignelater luminosus]|uniref:Uncharacterized protein n=1 Tax=Ignelater luminosus TaxID=2038154 RepID=A0A8K0DFK6_IGNLU|nr:hypothetical protein ILUMI_03991 [Ignelater luminosus]